MIGVGMEVVASSTRYLIPLLWFGAVSGIGVTIFVCARGGLECVQPWHTRASFHVSEACVDTSISCE